MQLASPEIANAVDEALPKVVEHRPDLVLMDISRLQYRNRVVAEEFV